MIAVLTADLIDSSLYEEELLLEVLAVLKEEFQELEKEYGKSKVRFNIFRGDSFQGVIEDPAAALHIAIQIKTAVNQIHLQKTEKSKAYSKIADFRMALGIGTQNIERKEISESNGEAFQFSGRTLDEMKGENRKMRLKTGVEEIDNEFDASLLLLETITDKWSTASAEVVYYLLQELKEREVAKELNITQSAVNQRKKAAGWDAVSRLLQRYNHVMKNTFINGK